MSEELTFQQKLISLIGELKAPKGQKNTFGKYNFRSAEDILEAVKPLAVKYSLLPNLSDEIVIIGERYYIKATASISDGEATKESIGYARESETKKGMDDSQITGTASSYARKYAMNGLYLIDDTKDSDSNEYQNVQNKPVKQEKSIDKTKQEIVIGKLKEFAEKQGMEYSDVLSRLSGYLQINSEVDKLTEDDFGKLMNYLNQNLTNKNEEPRPTKNKQKAWD